MSKEITAKDVKHIGDLARIKIEDHQIEEFESHMKKVLSYVDELTSIDTKGVEPMFSLVREFPEKFEKTLLRKDKVEQSLETKEVLQNAPATKDNQFKVNAVMEEN